MTYRLHTFWITLHPLGKFFGLIFFASGDGKHKTLQNFYHFTSWSSLCSLNLWRIIVFDIFRVSVGKFANDSTINANVFLCYQNNQPGVVGIGWVGSTCFSPNYRTVVVEWFGSDVITGHVTLAFLKPLNKTLMTLYMFWKFKFPRLTIFPTANCLFNIWQFTSFHENFCNS